MKKDNFKPVFVTGVSRTGSKIYMNILNEYSNIAIAKEIHFINPRYLHNDFVRTVKKEIGKLETEKDIDKLIKLMYSGSFFGTFWKDQVPDLDQASLKKEILASDKEFKTILRILLEEFAKKHNKDIPGAKYPVHLLSIPRLRNWYSDAKIIHTVRDPRAIYASQSNKWQFEGYRKNALTKALFNFLTFSHVCASYWYSFLLHIRISSKGNYYLIKFEDLVQSPEVELKKLCNFLGITYKEGMLNPPLSESSHTTKKMKGFNKDVVYKWKEKINPITSAILYTLTFIPTYYFNK
ncbi:MAG: sulfotransferase [Sulfurimonas sp.]|jgi:hypothetical protein